MRDYEYSDLYFDSHLDKQIKIDVVGTGITIDNSMIELDAFELDEMLCSEQELIFGSCEANCVKFTARDMPGSIVGKTIRITETVDGNTDVPFSYGIYKVYSDVPSSDRTKREITAYDAMYDIVNADVKSWYADLPFPMTLRQFRDSFFAHFGITQKETTLVNDGMTVNKTLVATQTDPESTITEEPAISGKTVIEAICEINGVFGNINRDGLFEYVELEPITQPLYPSNDLYPREDLFPRDPNTISMTGHYITFDYEDFQSKAITQLEIRPSDDSAGATVGTSGNNYVISGNFLVSDKTGTELEEIAANTLSIIRKASYTPLKSSEIVGNPCIELGDPIRFNTTREIIESYVLQRTLTGIQNKRDSIVSPGTETYKQNPNSIRDQISSVEKRTNKLERTADHTLSEIKAVDSKVDTLDGSVQESVSELETKIEQTASSIVAEVSQKVTEINKDIASVDGKVDDLSASVNESVTEMNSKIEQTASSIRSEVSQSITIVDSNAQGYAAAAEGNAISAANVSTDEKLKKYSTTTEIKNVVEQTAESTKQEITKTVSDGYSTKEEAKSYANSAETNANASTDSKLKNYSTTTEMKAEIEKSAAGITQTVSENHYSKSEMDNALDNYATSSELSTQFSQTARSISISANGGEKSVGLTISLYDENGNLIDKKSDTANITITGLVSFEDLENEGKTTINGSNIKTGTLSADLIRGGVLRGETKLLLGGNAESDSWLDHVIAYSDNPGFRSGQIFKIGCDTLINGFYVSESDGSYDYQGTYYERALLKGAYIPIDLSGANGYLLGRSEIYSDHLRVANLSLANADENETLIYGNVIYTPSLRQTSDRNKKSDIRRIEEKFDILTDRLMDIVCCFYISGLENLGHKIGFIAQDVELAISECGLTDDDIGVVSKECTRDEFGNITGVTYSLEYNDFIGLLFRKCKRQDEQIESLKQENLALQNRVSILEQKMEVLENVINNKINQS